jgi:hypothetical protein
MNSYDAVFDPLVQKLSTLEVFGKGPTDVLDAQSLLMLRIKSEGKCTHLIGPYANNEDEYSSKAKNPSLFCPVESIHVQTSLYLEAKACVLTTPHDEWHVDGKQAVECALLCLHAIDKTAEIYKRATVLISLPDKLRWARKMFVRRCEYANDKYGTFLCCEPFDHSEYSNVLSRAMEGETPVLLLAPDYENHADNVRLLRPNVHDASTLKQVEWVVIRNLNYDDAKPTIGNSLPLLPSFTPPDERFVIEVSKRVAPLDTCYLRGWPIIDHAEKIKYYNWMVRSRANNKRECFACIEMRKAFGLAGNKRKLN